MTHAELLEQVETMLKDVTPGPWRVGSPYFRCTLNHAHGRGDCEYLQQDEWLGETPSDSYSSAFSVYQDRPYTHSEHQSDRNAGLVVGMTDWEEGGVRTFADARLIATAPDLIRALAAALRDVTAQRAALEARLDLAHATLTDFATNYDHDEDAHRYGNTGACQVCTAEKALAALKGEPHAD